MSIKPYIKKLIYPKCQTCFFYLSIQIADLQREKLIVQKKKNFLFNSVKIFGTFWILCWDVQTMLRRRLLTLPSLLPKSPPSTKWLVFLRHPPVGVLSLNGHRKFEANLKLGPTVKISCTRSSTQMMLYLPSFCSMMSLEVIGVRRPSSLAKPRL